MLSDKLRGHAAELGGAAAGAGAGDVGVTWAAEARAPRGLLGDLVWRGWLSKVSRVLRPEGSNHPHAQLESDVKARLLISKTLQTRRMFEVVTAVASGLVGGGGGSA
jgi:hypothetical protein